MRLDPKERRRVIISLRKDNVPWEVIAEKLDVGLATAKNDFRYGMGFTEGLVRSLKKRDQRRCLKCSRRTDLFVHHICAPNNHRRNNLITLCAKCHSKAHRSDQVRDLKVLVRRSEERAKIRLEIRIKRRFPHTTCCIHAQPCVYSKRSTD